MVEAHRIREKRGQVQRGQKEGPDIGVGGTQQTLLLFLDLSWVGAVVEIEPVGLRKIGPQQELADIMQQSHQERFFRIRVIQAHRNFAGERGTAMRMLPELVKSEVVPSLLGVCRLKHGGTYGHMPNRFQIDPNQDGFKIFGIDGVAAFSGLKTKKADTEGRIHFYRMGQLAR